ncbi:putative ATP-dependent RNA helicase dhx33 [Ameca splendens]|uniref:RNA helicase n=1 Tax=Ameca splendens TaxID=208324 RepID=A0ABV0ZF68_9TELE
MTGQEEIEALARTCRDIARHLPDSCGPMVVIPLYASLPPAQQLRVFQPAPKGCRKVILATNIAETSVTISGIKFVIDTGMVKAKRFNPGETFQTRTRFHIIKVLLLCFSFSANINLVSL